MLEKRQKRFLILFVELVHQLYNYIFQYIINSKGRVGLMTCTTNWDNLHLCFKCVRSGFDS